MPRFQSHNPRQFVDILVFGGCVVGKSNASLTSVRNPRNPALCAMIRMDQPVHPETRAAHLENLGIPETVFAAWFESYKPSPAD